MKNRLRVLRAERDWTQEDLARELGISRQAVIAIEKEKYDPSLPLAFKISRLFQERIEDIFRYQDAGDSDSSPTSRVSPDREPATS
jgi:putative transcriptional regulator